MERLTAASIDRERARSGGREEERARLETLVELLRPLIGEMDEACREHFPLTVLPGETPRLWIDATSHVAIGRDRQTYRILRDTHRGRLVVFESAAPGAVADEIVAYLAERLRHRARLLEADRALGRIPPPAGPSRWSEQVPVPTLALLIAFLTGIAAALGAVLAFTWFARPPI